MYLDIDQITAVGPDALSERCKSVTIKEQVHIRFAFGAPILY